MRYVETSGKNYFEFESRGQLVKVPIEFSERHKVGGRDDLLARAIGKKKSSSLFVLDLTAGLGRDAFHMALIGCEVLAIERNITLAMALQTAWRSKSRGETLSFEQGEALDYLKKDSIHPDVIFYDPMFPEKKKSALAGKESQLLQLLSPLSAQAEPEEKMILAAALAKAPRVVVKRPITAPPILRRPDIEFKGKSVRYDVYIKT
jgi:16S rRNA (guanine1516-N2)-methyltransferase